MNAYELFQQAWEAATKIDFKEEWKNGTGYLDFLATAPGLNLEAGSFLACLDDYGRRVLIKGMGYDANIVVFERHTHGNSEVLVNNCPSWRYLKKVGFIDYVGIPDGQLSTRSMEIFLGIRENKFILSEAGVKYLNDRVSGEVLAEALEDLVTRGQTEGITEKELLANGFDFNSLCVYQGVKEYL